MSGRWDDWEAIEAAQAKADRPEPKVIPFRRQGTPERPTEAAQPDPDSTTVPSQSARPQVSDARGMRLLIRWWRHIYNLDDDE